LSNKQHSESSKSHNARKKHDQQARSMRRRGNPGTSRTGADRDGSHRHHRGRLADAPVRGRRHPLVDATVRLQSRGRST